MEKVADKYKLLLKHLRTRENGPVVDSMKRLGLNYKRSFGVSLIDLKAIAKEYAGEQNLALYLWQKEFRETKILSLMIANAQQLDEQQINDYISGINNIELAEQAAMNLLSKLPNSLDYAYKWSKKQDEYVRVTALLVLSRIALTDKSIQAQSFEPFFELFYEIAKDENLHVKKALGRALLQIGRHENLKEKVINFVNEVIKINEETAAWLKEEVVYFLEN
ncbi:MAG: DNA alkylation repair protein [Bacteroidales bacterium]|nr:DNA alkylation repair protein [Bacteroidales bacterium]